MDIKSDIFKYGKTIFSTKGFKKTNIKEIAQSAGIGVGTFYNYYTSKEQLFLEIYIQENENFKKRLIESIDLDQEPVKVMNQLIMKNIEAIETNPILKEWYSQDFYKELEQYYRNEGSKNIDSFRDFYMDLFKNWKAQGKIREDIDDDLLPVFFDSLVYIDTHKDEIGVQHFPKIIQYLAEFIMQGLTNHHK
ncbi:TetR/AcrR family transcriptional regulator [Neobacillus massiliamazoniensis]|uniref:TetR family transcriptional regulator n=1 Tax=Neobacillus massiliamazoniensis TaxID=1499688 RepID=A0A0U1NYV2_9BACI|nr:TetR/AcrR family transcriptional regulator [Neobacillus massiliamazoniensis]CRK83183.1 TetR family transcriptional regulator [Neobacillus massiliamazoniensis]